MIDKDGCGTLDKFEMAGFIKEFLGIKDEAENEADNISESDGEQTNDSIV